MRRSSLLSLALLLLAACGEGAQTADADPAVTPEQKAAELDLTARAAKADAVFSGRVVDVRFRDSQPDASGLTVPFTFVTWEVERGVLGVERGETVTLRFLGGRAADGRILVGSEQPLFQEGDADLIFALDDESGCPLVDCSGGRLRFIDGQVFDNSGHAIVADGERLLRGGWRDLPEINVVSIDGTIIEHNVDRASVETPDAVGMSPDALLSMLEADIAAAGVAPRAELAGSDIAEPVIFSATAEHPVAPPAGAQRAPEAPAPQR